ncbi:hypothetical protein [Paraburkholderia sp. GAS32]|uniref:hypothetical protein n=1 Tax=Paraburkholderia sp. GAS32 TaxID=3035129 RepID=UPI003D1A53B7
MKKTDEQRHESRLKKQGRLIDTMLSPSLLAPEKAHLTTPQKRLMRRYWRLAARRLDLNCAEAANARRIARSHH